VEFSYFRVEWGRGHGSFCNNLRFDFYDWQVSSEPWC
jgi:hypothetical protein